MAQWNKNTQDYLNQERSLFEVNICADRFGNIGACGGDALFLLNVSSGITTQLSNVHKFGAVNTSSATYDTIWTPGGAYEFPDNPGTISVVSTDAADNPAGIGASSVTVQGLDGNYNPTQETLNLNGTVAVGGTVSFLRTHRAFIEEGNTNIGRINISIASTITCAIEANMGQSQVAFYTVPAGKSAFLTKITATQNKNQENSVRLFQREHPDGVTKPFRLVTEVNLYGSNIVVPYAYPIFFTEKTDLEGRTYTGSNCKVSMTFDMIIVDNTSIGIGTT